MDFQKPKMI